MAQDKRTFLGGMNKDVDTRLIKNPDYIDALNIRVASSTDGTIGSVENIEGNKEVPFEFYSEGQDSLFVNDNGLYQQFNPATVFYQKVVRIQGWESVNQNYSFTLYSITDNGDSSGYGTIPIGEFNWVGNEARTATTQYLYSQFSGVGGLNTGINVYDVNTNSQYTASVKLLSFGQNSLLSGGYLDIVIECDVAGVDFHLGASSNLFNPRQDDTSFIYQEPVDYFTYTFDEDSDVKITSSGDAYISLLSSFETGGVYNAEANDDGVLISPEGQIYEMGNRTVWKIDFEGNQPTSPTSFEDVTIYSYRENLVTALSNMEYDSLPFLTIKSDFFDTNAEFEFDSTKTSFSRYLINEFSNDKAVLCNGLPLDFLLGSDNFFLTFSGQDKFSFDSGIRSIIIYGPVGVNFKLALADSSESLHNVLDPNQDVEDSIDTAEIFNNNSIIRLQNLQVAENSINITDSITNHINELETRLNIVEGFYENAIYNLEEQVVDFNNLQQEFDDLEANSQAEIDTLNAQNAELDNNIQGLQTVNDYLENTSSSYLANFNTLNSSILQLNEAVQDLDTAMVPIIDIELPLDGAETNFNTLAASIVDLINTQNQLTNSNQSFIADFNETFADEISAAGQIPAVDAISLIIVVEDIIANLIAQGGADLDDALIQYEVSINQYVTQVVDLTNLLDEATSTIASLQETINNLVISDLISNQIFNNTHSTYISINNLYENTLSLYNSLSVTNQLIHNENFGRINSFAGNWLLYENVFSNSSPTSLSTITMSVGNGLGISNPSGYEFTGYLKMPIDSNGDHSAVRLPYSQFDNSSAWQVGSEMTIRIEFDIVNTSDGPGANLLPSNYQVIVTNEWDSSNNFDAQEPYTFFENYYVTNGTVKNNNPFTHTFEVIDDGGANFNNRLKNITIIANPLTGSFAENIEVRIINVRISNDSQEMFAFANIEPANNSRENYLDLHSQIENVIVGSGGESIEDFLGSTDEYQEFLGNLIPGYIGGNSSLPALLDAFTADVVAFTSNVQNQFSHRLSLYVSALGADSSNLSSDINNAFVMIIEQDNLITNLQAEIDSLNAQISDNNDFNISLGNTNETTYSLFNLPNFTTGLFNIVGPEPALGQPLFGGNTGQISSSSYGVLSDPQGISFQPEWRINGNTVSGDKITLVTIEEYNNLLNNQWSSTNNIIYYITNRFQNNQAINIEIPGGQYPTQKCHILFVNFDNSPNLGTEFITNNTWAIVQTDSNNTINGESSSVTSSGTESFNFIITEPYPIARIVKYNIIEANKYYQLSYDITSTNSDSGLSTDTSDGDVQEQVALDTTLGSHTTTYYSRNTDFKIKRTGFNTNITISNISLKEIIPPILDGSVNPVIETGLNVSGPYYTQSGYEFDTIPALQMLIYFDETEEGNVTFSEDLYINKFGDGTSGASLFYNLQVNTITKIVIATINSWSD